MQLSVYVHTYVRHKNIDVFDDQLTIKKGRRRSNLTLFGIHKRGLARTGVIHG